MSRFNPGDKVVYISHDGDTYYIPRYGTIGTVVKPVSHYYYLVQWPEGSVSAPYKWHALDSDLELATKETEEKDMFKVGDRVEIKSWDEMVKEFGVDSDGDIRNPGFTFVRMMKPFCGKTATITAIAGEHVFLSDWSESLINTDWEFSVDMLKKPTPKSVPHAPATPAFKVGDIIRGTSKANGFYSITDINMTKAQVVNCWPAANLIEVKILSHKTKSREVGERYTVHPEYFELVDAEVAPTEPPKTDFKVGDIVRGKRGNRYGITNDDMERAEVIRATARSMRVKILKHRYNHWERHEFDVDNSDKEFELVDALAIPSTADSFEMVFKPPFTYAVLRDAAGHVVVQGEAKCSSEDTFTKVEGAALATQRLLEKLRKPSAAEKPFFSRDNLKTGDWVYTAEDVYQVFESPAFGKVLAAKSGFLAVAELAPNLFDDDPTGDIEFNVCKVVRPTKGYQLCYDHRADGECIFERK